jgi:hypothetical protein
MMHKTSVEVSRTSDHISRAVPTVTVTYLTLRYPAGNSFTYTIPRKILQAYIKDPQVFVSLIGNHLPSSSH